MNLVVGASGMLGAEICRKLVEEGKQVRALVRGSTDPAKRDKLKSLGANLAYGDLKDASTLETACLGISTVLSTASSTFSRQAGDSIESVDSQGQFGAYIIHAEHFHSELHARYLPRSTSFANRSLASFKLKRFGSTGPCCSNRWSMLRKPSSITSRRISQVLGGRSGWASVSMAMTTSTCAGVPIDSPSFCRFSISR